MSGTVDDDEEAARALMEHIRWPDGPMCPRGSCRSQRVTRLAGTKQTHRAGLFMCNACRRQFTVTVGTVLQRSKVPLSQWLLVIGQLSKGEWWKPWALAEHTGLTFKTIEKMLKRLERIKPPVLDLLPPDAPEEYRLKRPSGAGGGKRALAAARKENALRRLLRAPKVGPVETQDASQAVTPQAHAARVASAADVALGPDF